MTGNCSSSLFALLVLISPAALTAGEADPVARIVRAATDYGTVKGTPAELPSLAAVRETCGSDTLCAAREIEAASEGRARLEPVAHPETDTIRWAETAPSVTAVQVAPDGRHWIVLDGFGRKVVPEMVEAMAGGAPLGLDLRGNAGGDFGRMLKVAALFTGDVKDALFLIDNEERSSVSLSGRSVHTSRNLTVLVGPGTVSSAEVLAALLQRYAGARLIGSQTAGKDHLTRVIAIDHDWRLLVPAERIEVPGVDFTGGLEPAEGLPADLPPGLRS